MSIENIKQLMDGVDIAALLPNIDTILRFVRIVTRIALIAGPVVLLFLGLHYFLLAPKEANYTTGYRFRWGMASVESWRFMQRVAGTVWTALGLGLVIAMGILLGSLGEMEIMDLLWLAVNRLLMQAAWTLGSCVVIDLIVFLFYDRKGKRRISWWEMFHPSKQF